jgi:ribonuclease R
VQSAILDFDARGRRRRSRFVDGVIRSKARLTYEQVAGLLDGEEVDSELPRDLLSMLRCADRLRVLLQRRRRAQGSIDFDLPEPQILLDVEGAMTGITVVPRNRAHRMIEEFMLAANRAVAEELERAERDCLFRVHEPPDPAKMETLARFVRGLGLRPPSSTRSPEPRQVQQMLEQAEGGPEYRVVGQLAVRSMQQARYCPENLGHFGLAARSYCHFTSPIRRYPDLVVHRQLRAARLGHREPHAGSPRGLQALGRSCSELERNAEAAERELLLWKKLAFIQDHVGETFEGVITGVARFGIFVQLVENLVEGLVRVELLGDEYFVFDEARLRLTGSASGDLFRLGMRVEVRVDRVDRVLLRADFSLTERRAPTGDASPSDGRKDRSRRPRGGRFPRGRAAPRRR